MRQNREEEEKLSKNQKGGHVRDAPKKASLGLVRSKIEREQRISERLEVYVEIGEDETRLEEK